MFLWLNDGWSGHGWGDFGIEINVIAAAATIAATAVGVGARRAVRRDAV